MSTIQWKCSRQMVKSNLTCLANQQISLRLQRLIRLFHFQTDSSTPLETVKLGLVTWTSGKILQCHLIHFVILPSSLAYSYTGLPIIQTTMSNAEFHTAQRTRKVTCSCYLFDAFFVVDSHSCFLFRTPSNEAADGSAAAAGASWAEPSMKTLVEKVYLMSFSNMLGDKLPF
jgi:hypothetical protein